MIKAVAFDAFGTLLFRTQKTDALNQFYSGRVHSFEVDRILTHPFSTVEELANDIGLFDPIAVEQLKDKFEIETNSAQLYDETIETLRAVRNQGFKTIIISNLGFYFREPIKRLGLEPFFDSCVYSFEQGVRKPDPRIFKIAVDSLNLESEELLMVGDSLRSDFNGAKAFGASALHLDREHKYPEATHRIDSLRGVLDYLKIP